MEQEGRKINMQLRESESLGSLQRRLHAKCHSNHNIPQRQAAMYKHVLPRFNYVSNEPNGVPRALKITASD